MPHKVLPLTLFLPVFSVHIVISRPFLHSHCILSVSWTWFIYSCLRALVHILFPSLHILFLHHSFLFQILFIFKGRSSLCSFLKVVSKSLELVVSLFFVFFFCLSLMEITFMKLVTVIVLLLLLYHDVLADYIFFKGVCWGSCHISSSSFTPGTDA